MSLGHRGTHILTSQLSEAQLCDEGLRPFKTPKAPLAWGTPIKIRGVSHPLEGFYRGLGVVKGEGVASAKKALPFPLKKETFLKFIAKTSFGSSEIKNRWAVL